MPFVSACFCELGRKQADLEWMQ